MRSFVAASFLALVATAPLACTDQTVTPSRPASSTDAGGGPGTGGDAGAAAAVRFATFNMHLFFDMTCDSGNCGAGDFEEVRTQTQFDEQVRLRATAIERIDPDVIALQEIEDQVAFDALTAKLEADGFPYDVKILGETGAPGSVDVAVLARHAKDVAVKTHRDETLTRPDGSTTTFAREFLETRLTYERPGFPASLVFFAAHFRSKAGGDDPGRRLAEAQKAHDIMLATAAELPDAYVVLGGDLNDEPGSPPLLALEGSGELVSLTKDLTSAGTFVYQGTAQQIDHLIATAKTATHLVPGSAAVLREGNTGFGGSDHAALEASLSSE